MKIYDKNGNLVEVVDGKIVDPDAGGGDDDGNKDTGLSDAAKLEMKALIETSLADIKKVAGGADDDNKGDAGGNDGDDNKGGDDNKDDKIAVMLAAMEAKLDALKPQQPVKNDGGGDDKQQDVYKILFQDKLNAIVADTPGFSEFLESTDAMGRVHREEMFKVADFGERVEVLNTLKNSFIEATANNAGVPPVVDKRVQKKMKEHDKAKSDINKKWLSGEIGIADYTENYLAALEKQLGSLF